MPSQDIEPRDVPTGVVELGTVPSPDMGDYAAACPPDDPCPTLEQALALDDCLQITVMCGLWRVSGTALGFVYWYDGFGAPPVAAQTLEGAFGSTIAIECNRVDLMCSTCGAGAPRCDTFSDWLPGPVPAPEGVAGCACESIDSETARVSLECFCDVYGCESYSVLTADCSVQHYTRPPLTQRVYEACGQAWFYPERAAGPGFAFDTESGALVAAEAASSAPVTAPCGTHRVIAGAPASCDERKACSCEGRRGAEACALEPWFPELPY